jgi:phosphoribosyl-ATP pyrophosphohydrolase
MDVLAALEHVIAERRQATPDRSYVAGLLAGGVDKVARKVGEEAVEVVIAAKNAGEPRGAGMLVGEVADLWFHTLVLLAAFDLSHRDVLDELERRFGTSGIVEKARRRVGKPAE